MPKVETEQLARHIPAIWRANVAEPLDFVLGLDPDSSEGRDRVVDLDRHRQFHFERHETPRTKEEIADDLERMHYPGVSHEEFAVAGLRLAVDLPAMTHEQTLQFHNLIVQEARRAHSRLVATNDRRIEEHLTGAVAPGEVQAAKELTPLLSRTKRTKAKVKSSQFYDKSWRDHVPEDRYGHLSPVDDERTTED